MKQTLRLLAPYFAVGIFWCILSNGWLALLAYHGQTLFWSRQVVSELRKPSSRRTLLTALPMATAGPLLYFLLPYVTHTDLSTWLENHHLSRLSLILMVPYYGFVHPLLEQLHWTQLRERTSFAHPLFAGYHMIVLYSLLSLPWLLLCFAVLVTASLVWQQMTRRSNSLSVAVASHILADLGIITAAYVAV